MNSPAISALYSSQPLCLWVEDDATKTALRMAWPGDPVEILVGGSNETIRAVVEDAWRSGLRHVFGVVDRDFGRSNHSKWAAPSNALHTYVLQSPEIENLVLEPAPMAACAYNTGRRSEAEIALKLEQIVSGMTWWMACCAVLATVRQARNEGFPSFPTDPAGTVDLASALACFTSSQWFMTTASTLPAFANTDWLAAELQREEARLALTTKNGLWRTEFSGKQVLQRVSGFVYTTGKGKGMHTELLQAVVQEQVVSGTLSSELRDLRSSLRTRVGLRP